MKKTIEEMRQENFIRVLKDGPRLHYGQNTWVVAKDTKNGLILIGGLGAMGCGEMVVNIGERGHERDGFDEAPEREISGLGLCFRVGEAK